MNFKIRNIMLPFYGYLIVRGLGMNYHPQHPPFSKGGIKRGIEKG
jgi:hypothetical protein